MDNSEFKPLSLSICLIYLIIETHNEYILNGFSCLEI